MATMRTQKIRARAKARRHRSSSRKESPNSGTGAGKPSAECASSSRKQTRTSLDGNVRRAIDIHEGEEVDESAFKALVRQAVALNSSGKSKPSKKAKS